jgi:hypothetical protein
MLAVSGGSCERAGRSPSVVVYYFHNQIRCESCLKIERYSKRAVEQGFAKELGDGTIEWRVHNLDLEESQPFRDRFQISSAALIISRVENGRPSEWKSLDDVWVHLGDPEAFSRYVTTELAAYLAPGDAEGTTPPSGR